MIKLLEKLIQNSVEMTIRPSNGGDGVSIKFKKDEHVCNFMFNYVTMENLRNPDDIFIGGLIMELDAFLATINEIESEN